MSEVLILNKPDGTVVVVHPTGNKKAMDVYERTVDVIGMGNAPYSVKQDTDLPTNRDFRDAWSFESDKVIEKEGIKSEVLKLKLIEGRKKDFVEQQVISQLKTEGKLPADFKLTRRATK